MHTLVFPEIPSFFSKRTNRFLPLFTRAFLVLAFCLSAAVPVSVVSSNSPAEQPGSPHQAVVDVCVAPVITTDTTWTTGNIYQANCIITVNAGVTLTVEGGAVVQFGGASYGLRVLGTLVAEGSSDNQVVFTSGSDNAANTWYGIVLYENSAASFEFASIRYGGSGVCAGGYEDATYNSCYNRAQLDVRKANLQMVLSEVRDGHVDGICLDAPGKTPYIHDTTISNNTNGNSSDNIGQAINQTTINMQPDYLNLVFSGNDFNKVGIHIAQLNQDVILGGAPLRFYCGFTSCPIEIPAGRTLTIQQGALLDMTSVNSTLSVLSGGTLLIQGTESYPVTINEAGIDVAYGGVAHVSYCDIGGGNRIYYGLYDRADGVTVNNSTFHNFYLNGIYIYSEANNMIQLTMNEVNLLNNANHGIQITTGSGSTFDMSLDGGSISGNGGNGIAVGGGPVSIALKDVEIGGNGFTGSDWSVQNGIYANTNNVSLDLENVQLLNNKNESIYWYCNGSIRAKNLTATGNTRNALVLAGCGISTGREWDLGDAGIPVIVSSGIDVNTGGVLSITPGSTLGFESNTNLQVQPQGALYALGTPDKPITFTRAYDTQTPATAWRGLENYKGTLILRNCDVSYSNYWSSYGGRGIGIRLDGSTDLPTNTIIQNCKIHDNEVGIYKTANIQATTSIVYNEIFSNPTFGIDWGGYDAVNAYYNYWGSPTGPTHPSNPGGTGDKVDDNVNFIPFLTEPPAQQTIAGELWVSYGGPRMISPGEANTYAVQYLNLMDHAVEGAVAMVQLPLAATYLSSNHGGIYWPARNQVFWVLGDVEVGEQVLLSALVRFDWGLPGSYTDGSIGRFAGTNYYPESLNLEEYYNYVPDEVSGSGMISEGDYTALFGSYPDLETLYNNALAEGFAFKQAFSMVFDDGAQMYTAMMRTADKKTARMVILANDQASAITTDGSTFYRIEDLNGGLQANLLTLERTTWGDMAEPGQMDAAQVSCNYARCMRNCTLKTLSIERMKDVGKSVGAWLLSIPTGFGGLVGVAVGAYETVNTAHDVYVCHIECSNNPLTGCCQAGDVMHSPSFIGGSSRCEKYECNESLLSFPAAPNTIEVCGTGTRCVAGTGAQGGCKPCQEDTGPGLMESFGPQMAQPIANLCSSEIFANLPSCKDLGIRVAKDPNELIGPVGDVLPDETMNYRISYENEGAGNAYGVYIINNLPPELDASTLVIDQPNGVYLASERQIIWYVGELGPKGDPTASGEVTYSVGLQPGLTAGTAVVNQATVYFPSVPEETPTNSWTNLVYPLAAIPQEVETAYMIPVNITLAGKPAGGLSFALGTLPVGGVLSGTLPDLIYTPNEDFTGPDYFTFMVSEEGENSQAAQVTINVSPNGDSTPPSVLWTTPEANQVDVPFPQDPISPNDPEPVFQPIILVKFSENMKETSVSAGTITVLGRSGVSLPIKVEFDSLLREATILLLEPLNGMTTYTVSLSSAIQDLAGNALTQYEWNFTTSAGGSIFLPVIIR